MRSGRRPHADGTSRVPKEVCTQEIVDVSKIIRTRGGMQPSSGVERGNDGSHKVGRNLPKAAIPSLKNLTRVLQRVELQAGLHEEADLIIVGQVKKESVFARTDWRKRGFDVPFFPGFV